MSKSTEQKIVFVIRNQDLRYLTKKQQWRSGVDNSVLFRSSEKDIALNELIETNAKDVLARLELVECEVDKHNHPVVEVLADDPPEARAEDAADKGDDSSGGNSEADKPVLELVKNQEQQAESQDQVST